MVPLSVLANWTGQIQEHIRAGELTSHVYHDKGRSVTAEEMAGYDVVFTTYETVTSDWKRKNGQVVGSKKLKADDGLFGVKWKASINTNREGGLACRGPSSWCSLNIANNARRGTHYSQPKDESVSSYLFPRGAASLGRLYVLWACVSPLTSVGCVR